MAEDEKEGPSMRDLTKLPENAICADCDTKDPDWASINLGIFICIKCAGIHRNLGVHHSKVRSLQLDTTCWDPKQIEFMKSVGNVRAREAYEFSAPIYYMRPNSQLQLSPLVREHWIRAKYVEKMFHKSSNSGCLFQMPERAKQGWMLKANEKKTWQKRWFVLHKKYLYYFKSSEASYPKGALDVTQTDFKLPEDIDRLHRFKFELREKKVYPLAADKETDMFGWIHAIRRARLYYEKATESKANTVEKIPFVQIGKPLIMGQLTKQGGKWKSWNKRICVLSTKGVLYYFKKEPADDETPEGGIDITSIDICEKPDHAKKNCFSLISKGRMYFLVAETEQIMSEWISCINGVISRVARAQVDFADESLGL